MSSTGAGPGEEWQCPTCGRVCAPEFTVCPIDATPRVERNTGDPMIGEILGRTYKITKMIGAGGMARLYAADHLRIDASYAVKVIHDDLAREPDMLARFEREARAAGKIHSDHVVTLVDVLRTADGRPAIITELLQGEDLQARLDRVGKLAVGEAIPIARQLCRAVADAHAVGVVHRDLKPSNVFLCRREGDPHPHVKVFDFGVAKMAGDERMTRTDAVMGTAAYMAPEQARSANDAGPPSDVYAIGAVLYHMLAGVPPYGQVPALSRFALVLHEEPARPRTIEPSIPAGIEGVIQHAMARDRSLRATSAAALDAELAVFDRSQDIVDIPAEAEALDAAHAPIDELAGPAEAVPLPPPKGTDETAPNTVGRPAGPGAPLAPRTPRLQTQPGGMKTAITRRTAASAAVVSPTAAADITLKALIARPLAIAIAIGSAAAAGAWAALLFALLAGSDSVGERSLLAVIGIAVTTGVAALHIKGLRPKWQSGPAVSRHAQPYGRALVIGIMTLGLLDLFVEAWSAIFKSELLGLGARIALAGALAGLALGSRRFGLDERVRKRLG